MPAFGGKADITHGQTICQKTNGSHMNTRDLYSTVIPH